MEDICEHSAWVDGVWDCNVCGAHVNATPTPLADAAAIAEREALIDPLYILSMNEEAMEEAIEHFDGSSTGEALKCVLHAQKQIRAALATTEATDAIAPTEGAVMRKSTLKKIRKELLGEIAALCNRYFEHEEPAATVPLKKLVKEIDAALSVAPSPEAPAADAPPPQQPAETITIQEAWEAAGGNPGIKATRDELLTALRQLDEVCDAAPSPKPAVDALTTGAVAEPVAYGCHCDLDEGQTPDGCVIDQGNRDWCTRAQRIDRKEDCDMWKPIALAAHPASEPQSDALTTGAVEPVARLHITATDEWPDIRVQVLNGADLQPEMSPIDVYTHPASEPKALTLTDEQRTRIARHVQVDCARIPGATFYNAAEMAIEQAEALLANPET